MGGHQLTLERKKITFLTGTRADFGKQLPLIRAISDDDHFDIEIIATGMHLLHTYGYTINEIYKAGFTKVFPIFNQESSTSEKMDIVLANTIIPLSHYINERRPDMLIVHGDRVEALAGAIAGSLNNIRVAHIEGGEVSGTIDESLRHAISKLAHLHLVANEDASRRLHQLGEEEKTIQIIGSPEIDYMQGGNLPDISEVKKYYAIDFDEYALFIHHPVTTEISDLDQQIDQIVQAMLKTGHNYIVVKPNNDLGSNIIEAKLQEIEHLPNIRMFPSLRFEFYITLLKYARYIMGNSSSGVREAPVFGVPSVNIGSRQLNRNRTPAIFNVQADATEILKTISALPDRMTASSTFGNGNSGELFAALMKDNKTWSLPRQKTFIDRMQVEQI